MPFEIRDNRGDFFFFQSAITAGEKPGAHYKEEGNG